METRNFKVAGLALVAMLAMKVVLSSAARADFNSEAASTTLTVSSNEMQRFKLKATSELTIECETVILDSATMSGATTETVTVSPTYSNCDEDVVEIEIDVENIW